MVYDIELLLQYYLFYPSCISTSYITLRFLQDMNLLILKAHLNTFINKKKNDDEKNNLLVHLSYLFFHRCKPMYVHLFWVLWSNRMTNIPGDSNTHIVSSYIGNRSCCSILIHQLYTHQKCVRLNEKYERNIIYPLSKHWQLISYFHDQTYGKNRFSYTVHITNHSFYIHFILHYPTHKVSHFPFFVCSMCCNFV